MVQHQTQLGGEYLDELWGDLVVAMLSVNSHSLEKAYAYGLGLRSVGLCSPENLGKWGTDEIAKRLVEAGCNRGSFMTPLYAKRLSSLGAAVTQMGVDKFAQKLASKQRSDISALLLPINGIGPRVLQNFFLLRQIP